MAVYILKRTDGRGGYVAPPGSARSYVRDDFRARKYATREAAEADRCQENEIVIELPGGHY